MKFLSSLLLIAILNACGSLTSSSQQKFSRLEKPPSSENSSVNRDVQNENQAFESDENLTKGLYSDVYKLNNETTEIRIKRNIDQSWVLIAKAILLNEFKITGKNRKQGYFQISYKSSGLLDGFSLFGSASPAIYLVKLTPDNNETSITVSKLEDENDYDPGRLMDGAPDYSYDSSSKLSELIFQSLKKDVVIKND